MRVMPGWVHALGSVYVGESVYTIVELLAVCAPALGEHEGLLSMWRRYTGSCTDLLSI